MYTYIHKNTYIYIHICTCIYVSIYLNLYCTIPSISAVLHYCTTPTLLHDLLDTSLCRCRDNTTRSLPAPSRVRAPPPHLRANAVTSRHSPYTDIPTISTLRSL